MSNDTTTFENAKVGDKVYSITSGWGEISKITKDSLCVKNWWYTKDGKLMGGEHSQVLFWDEVKIDPPKKPKEKPKEKIKLEIRVIEWRCVDGYTIPYTKNICADTNEYLTYISDLIGKPPMKMTLEWEE